MRRKPSRGEWIKARSRCQYVLNGHGKESPSSVLSDLARQTKGIESDFYGKGKVIEDLEKSVARYFGKKAAAFFPSGIMAQMAALKTWSNVIGSKAIYLHPLCHIEIHEERAHSELMNLSPRRLCTSRRLPSARDLKKLKSKAGTVSLEIPQRDLFFQCPTWNELLRISTAARKKKIPLHLDGARILEAAPGFNKHPREVARLFDSVYISFYKVLGGISGAMLIGDPKWISAAKTWRRRMGGTLIHSYPVLVSAQLGWNRRIGKMRAYHRNAKWLAHFLREELKVKTVPEVPQSNSFCVIVPFSGNELNERAYRIAKERMIWFPMSVEKHPVTGELYFEVALGDAFSKIPKTKLKAALRDLLER